MELALTTYSILSDSVSSTVGYTLFLDVGGDGVENALLLLISRIFEVCFV
jgi:hypothetical protein